MSKNEDEKNLHVAFVMNDIINIIHDISRKAVEWNLAIKESKDSFAKDFLEQAIIDPEKAEKYDKTDLQFIEARLQSWFYEFSNSIRHQDIANYIDVLFPEDDDYSFRVFKLIIKQIVLLNVRIMSA